MYFIKAYLCIFLLFCSFLIPHQAFADTSYYEFFFDKEEIIIEKISGYDVIRFGDLEPSLQPGSPQLPIKLIHISLPPGKDISTVTIINMESKELEGEYNILPVQPPQILSGPHNQFVPPDRRIYSSSEVFPRELIEISPHGYFSGYNIGALVVYPIQYIPLQKKLIFHSKIEVQISLKSSERLPVPFKSTKYSESVRKSAVSTILKTSKNLYQPTPRRVQGISMLPDEEHVYVIITADRLAGAFELLAEWKLKRGLSAKIVTTPWIYENYPGRDGAEKVRNFIKDAYQNWGTLWVLLGGDSNIFPIRVAYAMNCEYGNPGMNYIPCDLYFSDLEGDWNANGNSTYGEVDDNIDMYPDVFVGRAPVEDYSEARDFVNKVIGYEISAGGCELNMLFLADILWDDPYTNSGESKDLIDNLYVPARFDPITKLYKALGNENYETAMAALNTGYNIINHDGHAYYGTMSVGSGYLRNSDMDALTNAPRYSILFSIGCLPAAFDYDCIAEHFITNPNGGGVAFIGNSRYGWGSPGNPLFGYSDRFDQEFFKQLFINDNFHIGNTLASTKTTYVPFASQSNVYRWCEYQINLLGDPEMPIWTNTARTLTVDHPNELPIGNSSCPVIVTDGENPVEGAMVCLMQDMVVYETALTGPNGRANFEITTSNPTSPIYLSVTAHNFYLYLNIISIISYEPYVQVSSYSTDYSKDGFIEPGKPNYIHTYFKNFGSETAQGISAVLRSPDNCITVMDSTELVGDILAGDSISVFRAFWIQSDTDLTNGDVIYLDSEISDNNGQVWMDKISVTVATPVLSFSDYLISDQSYGDGDGFAEAGEILRMEILAENSGLMPADFIEAHISSENPFVHVMDTVVVYWRIPSSGREQVPVDIEIDPGCPEPSFPRIDLLYKTRGGYEFSDSFFIAVGEVGFFDDMESGEGGWTHSGANDYWHLSEHRCHSGSYSWYAGAEQLRTYVNYMHASLLSPPIVIDENTELSFWCWYEFPNYGTDGFYVEVNDGSGWNTLDFIGSGGALGTLVTWNDWLEYKYDLSHFPAGTSISLRFRFVSDWNDLEEGVYVDDVAIKKSLSGDIFVSVPPVDASKKDYQLYQNYPNPFNPSTTIRYTLRKTEHVKIEIFNVQGARIRVLKDETDGAGSNAVVWDGKNEDGLTVSSGIYLYRMTAGKFRETKKMVFLK